MRISLNRNQLKYIVIIAMLLDHIAWTFFALDSVAGQIMHFVGRLTGPAMAYFLYEGYIYTRNIRKYFLRLGIFAVVSWPPFSLLTKGTWPTASFGVIYTLFLGLAAIYVWDRDNISAELKFSFIAILCGLSFFGDWAFYDVLWPLMLFINKDDPEKQFRNNLAMANIVGISGVFSEAVIKNGMYNLGVIMVPYILRYCYNGQSGRKNFFSKWFFYIFYPLHLLVLYIIKSYIL